MSSSLRLLKRINQMNRFTVSGYIRKMQMELTVRNIPTIVPYLCLAYYFNGHVVKFNKRTVATQNNRQTFTHFLSIRITNTSIVNLGRQIQTEIVDEYKTNNVEIDSSLINPAKFHISLNIVSLPTETQLNTFCNALHLFEQWLKIFIFENTTSDKQSFFHQIQNHKTFANVIENNNYLNRFSDIYNKILSSKYNSNTFPIRVVGANHFNQKVIFLDFQNKCQISNATDSIDESNLNNKLVLEFLQIISEFIGKLCLEYGIKCSSKKWIPHCTVMKISKMRRHQTQMLLNYNKKKVYDMEILSSVLNKSNIESKIESLTHNTFEMTNIDLCAMHGISTDGYYKVISTVSVAHSNKH